MDANTRFDELLKEMYGLIISNNGVIHSAIPYSLVIKDEKSGKIANMGSGDFKEQMSILMIHLDALKRICVEVFGDAVKDDKTYMTLISLLFTCRFSDDDGLGLFRTTGETFKMNITGMFPQKGKGDE